MEQNYAWRRIFIFMQMRFLEKYTLPNATFGSGKNVP
jgi:hypothetical protein